MCDGRYPIHFAADYGQTEVVEYLISKGANVNVSEEFLQGIIFGRFVRLCGVRHGKLYGITCSVYPRSFFMFDALQWHMTAINSV